jgi:Domain of unknown function (DUF5615)
LRLLVDEMYPAAVAEQLRRRGHDVVAVTERKDLRARSDPAIFAEAQADRRAVVTENVVDFVPIAEEADRRGRAHHGLVLIDPAKFPRGQRRTVGRLVKELGRLMTDFPGDDATSARHWL